MLVCSAWRNVRFAERQRQRAIDLRKERQVAEVHVGVRDEAAALEKGMEVKSVEFVKAGAEVYSKV